MARVIQDSDDELDDELEPEEHQAGRDASPEHSTGDSSSTEALRRQIEAAHRAHLQSQFLVHDGQTLASVEVNHSKEDMADRTGMDTVSDESFQTPFLTDKAGLTGIVGSLPLSQQTNHGLVGHFPQSAETTTGAGWVLDGTIREAYAQHDPNTMFPEPSSTIPNATLTQQRMMQGLHAVVLPGPDVATGAVPFEPVASIPWSEYLKSSPTTAEHPESSAREPHISQTTSSTSLKHSDQGRPAEPNRQLHRKGKRPSPGSTSDDDLADLDMPKEQYKPRPSRSRSSKVGTTEAVDYSIIPEKAKKTKNRAKSTPTTTSPMDSLSTPNRIRQICEMGFTPSTSARALQKNNGDVTQTVEWLITNRVADDELVTQTSPRSKATRNRPKAMLDTPVHDIGSQESGFDARHKTAIDVDVSFDAAAAHTTTADPDITTSLIDPRSPSKVQVIIPAKSPISIGEQAQKGHKRRKTTSDQPQPTSIVDAVKLAKAEKKRGRGRPRKATKDSASTISMQQGEVGGPERQLENHDLSSGENAQPTVVQDREDMKTENVNSTYSVQGPQSFEPGDTTIAKRSTPEPAFLPDRPEVEPITPERVKKAAPREQPSSNRGKMTYRVGLSKRARIAPLLRTMKK